MANETDESQHSESEERALLRKEVAEAQVTLATIKSGLAEVEAIRASLLETFGSAKTKLSEIQAIATAATVAR